MRLSEDETSDFKGLKLLLALTVVIVLLGLFAVKVKADCQGSRALVRIAFALESLAGIR